MDKTININLAGTLFTIDDEAYKILREYLQAIDLRFGNMKGGNETVEDIESRIAEIFQSQKGIAGVITCENVEYMISLIGKPEEFDVSGIEEEQNENYSSRKRLYRNPDDTIIAGVCGGIGAYLKTDPVLIRILFVIFTAFFLFGFFIYLILWIALPDANTETRKREMYGSEYSNVMAQRRAVSGGNSINPPSYNKGYYQTSRIGNALNEAFRAIGRVLFIVLRVILIMIGAALLLASSLLIISFVMIFVLKIPGAFSTDAFNANIVYLPDFLNYLVSPVAFPWIIILSSLVLILPLLALIYWGSKMIFWFRANDGVLSLVMIIVWAMSLTALILLLFSEGVSFAEKSRSSAKIPINNPPDTICLSLENRVSDLTTDKTLSFRTDGYYVLIDEGKKRLYISPEVEVEVSDEESPGITVKKESFGRSENEAFNKTKEIEFNYRISGNTLYLDDYFTLPVGRRWSGDNIGVTINLPSGTILKIDSGLERVMDLNNESEEKEDDFPLVHKEGYGFWNLTDEGLVPAEHKTTSQK